MYQDVFILFFGIPKSHPTLHKFIFPLSNKRWINNHIYLRQLVTEKSLKRRKPYVFGTPE